MPLDLRLQRHMGVSKIGARGLQMEGFARRFRYERCCMVRGVRCVCVCCAPCVMVPFSVVTIVELVPPWRGPGLFCSFRARVRKRTLREPKCKCRWAAVVDSALRERRAVVRERRCGRRAVLARSRSLRGQRSWPQAPRCNSLPTCAEKRHRYVIAAPMRLGRSTQ